MKNTSRINLLRGGKVVLGAAVTLVMAATAFAQGTGELIGPREIEELETPPPAVRQKESDLIDSVITPELIFRIDPLHSKIMKTKLPIARISITDPSTLEVNEFTPTEIELIGLKAGTTTLTMWFSQPTGEETMLRYLVKVESNEGDQKRAEAEFSRLQSRVNELFPQSQVQLIPVADKLIVRGQARDSKEAAEILALLGGQSQNGGQGGLTGIGMVANLPGAEDLKIQRIVNLLHVPGEQQVMLKVRIAEISRSAARNIGVDFQVVQGGFRIQNLLAGGAGNVSAILSGGDVRLFLNAFTNNGVGKLLAEPTLVTISGQPATFISGGEFAVPTTVGVGGVGAIATTFRGFGTQLTFTPTVIDKDKIRLQVAPSVSSINNANAVNGIPGLNTRGATTTVDLREGQWLAVAGLIQDQHTGSHNRIPFIGDVPGIGGAFGQQTNNRNETELVILVSPELVHPLEAEQVPLFITGMNSTEPTNKEFFLHQQIEGKRGFHYRSTVWPMHRHQTLHENFDTVHPNHAAKYSGGAPATVNQDYYISGDFGFSQ